MPLSVDAICETQRIGAAVHAANNEVERKAARSVTQAGIYVDSSKKCPAQRIEGVDLAFYKAEVATSRSPPKIPKLAGARAMPQGAASSLPLMSTLCKIAAE